MTGLSYPFDSGPGASITEDQWSHLMRDAVGTGVHEAGTTPGPNGSELKVFSLAEVGLVHLNPGRATLDGFHYQQGGAEVLTVTANANVTQDRIDAVVLRLDLTTNAITIVTKLGVPDNTPVSPAISSNELLLATYRVRKNSNTVLTNEVTDKRVFVGRRITVTDMGGTGREGDIQYTPTLDKWLGVVGGGFTEAFAFNSDITAHAGASDPHPQYLTAAEGNVTATTSTLTADPNVTTYTAYCRSLNLPGGYKIVNLSVYGHFDATNNQSSYIIYTIDDPNLRPNFSHRIPGHQWKFTNSSDDYPLIVRVDPSGQIRTDVTQLMGDTNFLFHCTYFRGTGV